MARFASCCLLLQLLYLPLVQCGHTLLSAQVAWQKDQTNLTDLITRRASSDNFVPAPVKQLLETWDNKPACHKAATRLLIVSCKSIKEDVTNPQPSIENLENTKSIFAARLAICELRDAGVSTPSQCIPITAVSGDVPGKITSGDLRACLKTLESKPQSWTSYSNSRQDSVAICAFSRADIMKDEGLELLRLLTTVGYGVSQALADAHLYATSQQEAEMAFGEALKAVHEEQLRDLAHLKESSTQLNEVASHVSDTIRLANITAADLNQLIETIFLSAATGGAELASIRFRDAEANHEAALALQELVQDVTNNDFAILRDGLSEVAITINNISTTVGKTAQNADLLQDATAAAIENVRIVETVVDGSQHKAVQLLESLDLLATPIEGLSKFFQTVKVIGSKGAVFAEMALGAWVVAKLFSRRHAQYLLLLHVIASHLYSIPYRQYTAIAKLYLASVADKLQQLEPFVINHTVGTLSLSLVMMAVCAATLYNKCRRRKLKAQRIPAIPPAQRLKNRTWTPAPYQDRFRRAKTTPPGL